MRCVFALALIFSLAAGAWADVGPPETASAPVRARDLGNTAKVGTLCWSQTATTTGCTYLAANGGNGDQIVVDLRGYSNIVLFSNQSTATTYTCDAYISDNGYDADSGVGQDRTTTSLAETQEAVVLAGPIAFLWIECAAIADNSVIVTFVATK